MTSFAPSCRESVGLDRPYHTYVVCVNILKQEKKREDCASIKLRMPCPSGCHPRQCAPLFLPSNGQTILSTSQRTRAKPPASTLYNCPEKDVNAFALHRDWVYSCCEVSTSISVGC